mmetsp:Transcript_36110/g.65047  ORF Transcript_36110/g.65047 Transcript_36110/m.65047 type:complete len:812 (-) Transcript_36110:199-2634(-)
MSLRQDELDLHVRNDLKASVRLSDTERSFLVFADAPFYISVGNDHFDLYYNKVVVSGDFATLGIVFSEDDSAVDLPCPGNCLRPYIQSIENLRARPSISSFLPRLSLYNIAFFHQRYDTAMANQVGPTYHGDYFNARSSNNIIFGDFLNAATLEFANSDERVFFYGDNEIYDDWVADPMMAVSGTAFYEGHKYDWAADTINALSGRPLWRGQKSSDIVVGTVQDINEMDSFIEQGITRLFHEQALAKQMKSDIFLYTIPYSVSRDVSLGRVCSGAGSSSYIPSHTWSIYLGGLNIDGIIEPRIFELFDLSPSPTVTSQPSLTIHLWYPDFSEPKCRNDGLELQYMVLDSVNYIHTSVEDCCARHWSWVIQDCRKKSLGAFSWYPAFNIREGGCRNDGLEPMYMKRFVEYMFDTLEECCNYYYPMNVRGCIDPSLVKDPCGEFELVHLEMYNEDYLREDEVGYYPNFESDDKYCVNDGDAPPYMIVDPQAWKHPTLGQCCMAYFQHLFRNCMGDSFNENDDELALTPCTELPELSGKWYVQDYETGGEGYQCVRECHGRAPCAGRAPSLGITLHDTYKTCCETQTWWKQHCESPLLSDKWYVKGYYTQDEDYNCVKECEGPAPCNGPAPPMQADFFESYAECCEMNTWWNEDCSNPPAIGSPRDDLPTCSDTYWETYFSTEPEKGYYPVFRESVARYCVKDEEALVLLVPFSDTWKYKTKAECCYGNFLFVFGECMHGNSIGEFATLPCSMSPALSEKWYVHFSSDFEKECVKECDIGVDSCNGRAALDTELYETFDECCEFHLQGIENSPC